MPRGPLDSAQYRLALAVEPLRRIQAAQRIGAAGHPLAAAAMARHGHQRHAFGAQADSAAAARAFAHAATRFFTSATIFLAASPRSSAAIIGSPLLARM